MNPCIPISIMDTFISYNLHVKGHRNAIEMPSKAVETPSKAVETPSKAVETPLKNRHKAQCVSALCNHGQGVVRVWGQIAA